MYSSMRQRRQGIKISTMWRYNWRDCSIDRSNITRARELTWKKILKSFYYFSVLNITSPENRLYFRESLNVVPCLLKLLWKNKPSERALRPFWAPCPWLNMPFIWHLKRATPLRFNCVTRAYVSFEESPPLLRLFQHFAQLQMRFPHPIGN